MRFLIAFFLFFGSPLWPMGPAAAGDPLIIVNKRTNELAWIKDGQVAMTARAATGKTKEFTPEGVFTVTVKAKQPYYRKKNIPGGDVRNPLGSRWIGFDARNTDGRTYGIHGTNEPESIGSYISLGCIRLPNEIVNLLYEEVSIGTKVFIVDSEKSFLELAREQGAIE